VFGFFFVEFLEITSISFPFFTVPQGFLVFFHQQILPIVGILFRWDFLSPPTFLPAFPTGFFHFDLLQEFHILFRLLENNPPLAFVSYFLSPPSPETSPPSLLSPSYPFSLSLSPFFFIRHLFQISPFHLIEGNASNPPSLTHMCLGPLSSLPE